MTNVRTLVQDPMIQDFLSRLEEVYSKMDHAYDEVAQAHGFHCQGCQDSCCLTLFFHHTFLEYLAIQDGCMKLGEDQYKAAVQRAREVIDQANHMAGGAYRIMCPVNQDGKCMIYENRPMICRLHGIHYRFAMPNGAIHQGIGCRAFEDLAKTSGAEAVLDRTPFYQQLAGLERELRQKTGFNQSIKMTVAEMLVKQSSET
ncbi:hypothetical protein [Desulfatibacillum aliphaticivorans]|uniref:YkgJ family cysteine cluster protein n=1 Tax=Desulfatibacillum aliphaticivorans TaxID=218208 RepID=B8F8W3_DESAL|nr:hypothetical protein [Desulfatibacillum aliphaticivorans]ACL01995.1 conserved hypothetical protein [Desulfatibacillum aliphaticivorans]